MNFAIIGAGLSGLTLANRLSVGHSVTVFEKSRGAGGRMSTRRAAPYAFDHGAQYFTAETDAFKAFLEPQMERELVASWPQEITLRGGARVSQKPKLVAAPAMSALCKSLASNLNVRIGAKIEHMDRRADGWHLQPESGDAVGPFDWVISSAPAPQAAAVMPPGFAGHDSLARVKMLGCFALMLGFDAPLSLGWTALKSGQAPVGWMAINSAKPGRDSAFSVLIQSSNEWAEAHLEADPDWVKAELLRAASQLANTDLSAAPHQILHRWRYAATQVPAGSPFLKDDEMQLAACGDWCIGGKIEAAYLSAQALAKALGS